MGHCTDCIYAAEHARCAAVPLFVVPQPERRSCRRFAWRAIKGGESCPKCEGGGWECYGLGFGDPHFRECDLCGNPEGLSSP